MNPEIKIPSAEDRLDSWKEIANYLGKGVRTVQRWEQTEGLPVHRLGADRASGSVFAYRAELDVWWQKQSRQLSAEPVEIPATPARMPQPRWIVAAAFMFVIAVALVARAMWPVRNQLKLEPFTSDHGWELDPSFSPDGRQVAFAAAPKDRPAKIVIKTIGADTATRLTQDLPGAEVNERRPAWSPDGRVIAYLQRSPNDTTNSLMLIPAAGGRASRLAELIYGSVLHWSPDGRWILAMDRIGKAYGIIAISVPSGERHTLTEPREFGYCGFAMAANMKRLVFCRGGVGAASVQELTLGPGLAPIGPPRVLAPRVWLRDMLVTPDLKEIIYTDGTVEEGIGLWRRRLSPGSEPEQLYATADRFGMPSLSADGKTLVFSLNRTYRENTWRLPLNGQSAAPSPVLNSTHSDLNPDYSPDGRHIAFHSTRSGASDIWVTDRDGGNARRLTFTNARTTATPRWSPDGAWIAYESNESGQTEVYLVRSSGGPARRMTENPAADAIPAWSRDGKSIYFCSDRTGRFEVWKMPAFAPGTPVQITRDGGFTAVESLDGKYLYYSQTRGRGPLWQMSLEESQATDREVIPEATGLFYGVSKDGIYYQTRGTLRFWDAATGQSREIFSPARPLGFGLAVAPDGKELLFTQIESQETDLYLLRGLR